MTEASGQEPNTAIEVVWSEPPAAHRQSRRGDWARAAAGLTAHPLDWAIVATCRTSNIAGAVARGIRAGGRYSGFSAGQFEAVSLIAVAGIPELPVQWRGGYWQSLVAGVGNFSTCQVIGQPRPLEFRQVNKVELVVT